LKSATELSSETRSAAKRIVTTLPSATEIVSLLGLEDNLIGITHECDYPPSVRKKPVVMRSVFATRKMSSKEIDDAVLAYVRKGKSIYAVDEELLQRLKPDLIITQELCEVCATPFQVVARSIAKLEPKPKILSLSPHNLEEVLENILEVGRATGHTKRAHEIVTTLRRRIDDVKFRCSSPELRKPTVFCLEWMDPLYCSGHWMPQLVKYAGGRELLGRSGEPSVVTTWNHVLEADPEVILVTVCGYDVERTLSEISALKSRDGWHKLKAVKNQRVFVLDGPSYFSRSGPRLVDGLEIMAFLLHPGLFPEYKLPKGAAFSLCKAKYL
jgi:iron complex transport system substrate-binding protein